MSRVGNLPISIPEKVEVSVADDTVTVKGPNGEITQKFDPIIKIEVKDDEVVFTRPSEEKELKSKHGLYRALINNHVIGVSEGYKKELELHGVGYRATARGQQLELVLGYSHPIIIELPDDIKVSAETQKGQPPTITLESANKHLIGQVAAKVRSFRKPEPYKGKGIRFKGEHIRRKAGKAAG